MKILWTVLLFGMITCSTYSTNRVLKGIERNKQVPFGDVNEVIVDKDRWMFLYFKERCKEYHGAVYVNAYMKCTYESMESYIGGEYD